MQVLRVFGNSEIYASDALRDQTVSALGDIDFGVRMFEWINSMLRIEHFNVQHFPNSGPPTLLCAFNRGPKDTAAIVAQNYLARFTSFDPSNSAVHSLRHGETIAVKLRASDIVDDEYRYSCYTSQSISEKLTFASKSNDSCTRINFYKRNGCGSFNDSEFARISTQLGLVLSLARKHCFIVENIGRSTDENKFFLRLKERSPLLSRRELDICQGIMIGHTTQQIADELNISIHTVNTYRRRAYVKMGISGIVELMRIVG